MITVQIQAPHFTAGIVAENGKVVRFAPILSYMNGWDGKQVYDYCKQKGWKIVKYPSPSQPTHQEIT